MPARGKSCDEQKQLIIFDFLQGLSRDEIHAKRCPKDTPSRVDKIITQSFTLAERKKIRRRRKDPWRNIKRTAGRNEEIVQTFIDDVGMDYARLAAKYHLDPNTIKKIITGDFSRRNAQSELERIWAEKELFQYEKHLREKDRIKQGQKKQMRRKQALAVRNKRIIQDYEQTTKTQNELAKKYGLDERYINRILRRHFNKNTILRERYKILKSRRKQKASPKQIDHLKDFMAGNTIEEAAKALAESIARHTNAQEA